MARYTNAQIANDYALWSEYFDAAGNMSRDEFDALTVDQRVALLVEAFGADEHQFTWETDGGDTGTITAPSLEAARAIFSQRFPNIAPECAGIWPVAA